jgi:hypothetical protein
VGGVGSGGARPGAGRPRKALEAVPPSRPGRLLAHPSVPAAQVPPVGIDESQAPNELTFEERVIWLEIAPVALARGRTLAEVQAYPFRLLCSNIALERRYAKSVTEAGSANHRGMIQAIDRELLRYGVVDFGKAAQKPKEKPANPFTQLAK